MQYSFGTALFYISHDYYLFTLFLIGLISSIRREGENAVIELAEAPFDPIVSEVDSADFAAEVALVSRNVKIQGEVVDDSSIGAYLMILHTQAHVQTIEGIEFTRMGQLEKEDRFVSSL